MTPYRSRRCVKKEGKAFSNSIIGEKRGGHGVLLTPLYRAFPFVEVVPPEQEHYWGRGRRKRKGRVSDLLINFLWKEGGPCRRRRVAISSAGQWNWERKKKKGEEREEALISGLLEEEGGKKRKENKE